MKIPKTQNKAISLVLIAALLHLNAGCNYYTYTTDTSPSQETLNQLKNSPNYIIVHQGNQVFHLSEVTINRDKLVMTGTLGSLPRDRYKFQDTKPKPGTTNRYIKYGNPTIKQTSPDVINEVHFFLHGVVLQQDKSVEIPLASIEKVDVYDPDTGATIASHVFGTLGAIAGVLAIVVIIVALTKSSCPFLYVKNGEEYVFAGEIYGGAIFKSLEREDFLILPPLAVDSTISIMISNKLKERQFINRIGLLQVTHPIKTSALADRHGKVHLISNHIPVFKATTGEVNITSLLKDEDGIVFPFDQTDRKDYFNEVVLTFPRDHFRNEGHLILHTKNSLWGDYVFGEFTKLFGSSYTSWIEKQNKSMDSAMKNWSADQGFALKVYVEENNEWKYVDVSEIVGPLAYRDIVLPVDLSRHQGDSVRIKLSGGFRLWDLDYAAMDFTADDSLVVDVLPPSQAITSDGRNVLAAVDMKDDHYLVQANTGDEVKFVFRIGEIVPPGMTRDFIVNTRGFYNHVRNYEGAPQLLTLLEFRTPGRFSIYSKEKYDEINTLPSSTTLTASVKQAKP